MDLGTCKAGFGFGGTGKKSNCRQFDDFGEPFGLKDVIGCYLDLDAMEIRYSKNGTDLGKAFTLRSEFKNATFLPAVVLKVSVMVRGVVVGWVNAHSRYDYKKIMFSYEIKFIGHIILN